MRYCLLLLSAVLVFIASCKKVEVPDSKEDILRASKWQMQEIKKRSRIDDTSFFVESVKMEHSVECKKDDYLEFGINNAGFFKSNEKKCMSQVDETAIRWGFSDNYTKMYIYEAGQMFEGINDINADVLEFSNDAFTIHYLSVKDIFDTSIPDRTIRKDTIWYTTIVKRF